MQINTPSDAIFSRALLEQAHASGDARLVRFEFEGRLYFAKKTEQHKTLWLKFFKGNPEQALRREAQLLKEFRARGASVPEILAQDDTCFVMADHGMLVMKAIKKGASPVQMMQRIGQELAELHRLGLAHGRPVMRDICWDGQNLTFLDLEAGAKLQATQYDKARDVLLLLHSISVWKKRHPNAGDMFLNAYFADAPDEVWKEAHTLARKIWWMEWLAAPVVAWHRLRHIEKSEFAAIQHARRCVLSRQKALAAQ
ncbi:lipopolysaccharide kinase InaA family protein [Roseinatronobacter bogoriensis]|uniref:Serine/threonine protein phosphatase n=1 Tax=Roseinatronobacter bogoriensis subsp. barguzinensis TaxID=441209 RepID=A0A2K8KDX7_9RHOB|nr:MULTISPECIES: lipopolysaccharide kinase InaA family protein [Rhodobaca]ATX65935.1 hypothetical protein BG454_08915 [Rhodobaca barguzinensis]MBB4208089.1 tRNA A-37 threonylcarbamoyl transferase component Bud32 [Rhodobaca bogoriensis DSM 18756]TDW38729.1 tRNA A-37 threonylcarbamoyl transferase component Bud32 [Rhodobaca barguzinensis]TDY69233.1 tRNA A-37 threonylcarbamoyl transferase component Bud32 [Rhodobaca bogoriensis DSM 18756]